MSTRKKNQPQTRDHALHDATHGQFGEEPRPEPVPNKKIEKFKDDDNDNNVKDRIRAARKKSRSLQT